METEQWRDAKIVEVKPLISDEDYSLPRKPTDFRYYMHFYGINRRNDDWVLPDKLKKTPYLVKNLKKFMHGEKEFTKEEIEYFENVEKSEEEGLDEKEQETHEKHTKVKTISEIQLG